MNTKGRIVFAIFGLCALLASSVMPAAAAEPDRFTLTFSDAYLVYAPTSGTIQITAAGNVLSYGGDWDVVILKPYLFHLRLKTWSGFYWKVNTSRKEVYKVTGGTFGSLGGTESKLNGITVESVGGSDTMTPDRFFLRFSDAKLVYVPGSGTLQISASGYVLSYGSDWEVTKIYDYLYHMRQNVWKDFYWKINTSRKEAYRVRGADFYSLGGTEDKLNIAVTVVGGDTGGTTPPAPGGGTPPLVFPGGVIGPIVIPGGVSPPTPTPTEDCIPFNPYNLAVTNISGNWKIVDGSMWLLDFGNNEAEAKKALDIIKYYAMNSQCFVGRPDPSFEYWLVGGASPTGGFGGEDCVSFNPATIEAKYVAGRWKIVDGNHWVFDFDQNEAEAKAAFAIIKKYGFTKSCYVGRPNPSFEYLRK